MSDPLLSGIDFKIKSGLDSCLEDSRSQMLGWWHLVTDFCDSIINDENIISYWIYFEINNFWNIFEIIFMVRMSSESGLNVDGAVLSWSIIPSGQSLVEIKSLRNDANTTPKRVPNVYYPL